MEDKSQYKDANYMKKNKILCQYCSYRCAVPSKNNQFCSELCRLLYFCITKEINTEDIGKLIKLSKTELIDIILTLKSQPIKKQEICKILKSFNRKHAFIPFILLMLICMFLGFGLGGGFKRNCADSGANN